MNNKMAKIIITFLLVALLVMIIGYSGLVQKLISNISNKNSNWQIEIVDIVENERNGKVSSREKTWKNTTASFEVDMTDPNDKISYIVKVKNAGTLDAKLDNIKVTKEDNPAFILSINNIDKGEIIKKGEEKEIYVSIEYSDLLETKPSVTLEKFNIHFIFTQDLKEKPIESALNKSNFKFETADVNGYENIIKETNLVRDDINLYGDWKNYNDSGIIKVTFPKQYNKELDNATLKIAAKGPGVDNIETFNVKDLLFTSKLDEYQYLYLFVKYYDVDTKQTLTFTINDTEYNYEVHILGEKQ